MEGVLVSVSRVCKVQGAQRVQFPRLGVWKRGFGESFGSLQEAAAGRRKARGDAVLSMYGVALRKGALGVRFGPGACMGARSSALFVLFANASAVRFICMEKCI